MELAPVRKSSRISQKNKKGDVEVNSCYPSVFNRSNHEFAKSLVKYVK